MDDVEALALALVAMFIFFPFSNCRSSCPFQGCSFLLNWLLKNLFLNFFESKQLLPSSVHLECQPFDCV
jgi:hypothetical protein